MAAPVKGEILNVGSGGTYAVNRLVELLGGEIGIDDLATRAGTIGYEILTGLSRRHHRVWLAPATGNLATGDQWTS